MGKVLLGALIVPWLQRRAFLRLMLYPALLFLAVRVALILLQSEGLGGALLWLAWPLYGAAFTVFAVRCHRLMLLPADATHSVAVVSWSVRETRFALSLALSLAAAVFVMLVAISLIVRILPAADSATMQWLGRAAQGFAAYAFARLCLVLPARAVDRPVGLRWAWRASRGNGWRLAVIVVLWPWLLDRAITLLYREEATFPEWAALTILAVLMAAIQVSALSLSYRELAPNLPDDEERSTSRRWPPLVQLATLIGAALALSFALPVWIPLSSGGANAPCSVTVLESARSNNGPFEIVAEHHTCHGDRESELVVTLREGGAGLVLYSRPASEEQAANWRRYVAWSWIADDRVDVLLLDQSVNEADIGRDRSWRGVQIRYRAAPPPGPASRGG